LSNFWLLISDQPMPVDLTAARSQDGVTAYYFHGQAERPSYFRINGKGRYVRVQLAGTNWLTIAELQVWAPDVAAKVNLAGGRHATQSSIQFGQIPEKAVDGFNGGYPGGVGNAAYTFNDANAWWQVDLGSVQAIDAIDIFNRTDCCQNLLGNFYLLVSDTPFPSTDLASTLAQSGVYRYFYGGTPPLGFRAPVGRTGRYVRLQFAGTGTISIAEIQVWSQQALLTALKKPSPPSAATSAATGKNH
jgi:hypothetical protein